MGHVLSTWGSKRADPVSALESGLGNQTLVFSRPPGGDQVKCTESAQVAQLPLDEPLGLAIVFKSPYWPSWHKPLATESAVRLDRGAWSSSVWQGPCLSALGKGD